MHISDTSTDVRSQEMMMRKRKRHMRTKKESQTYIRKHKWKQFYGRKEINKKEKEIFICIYSFYL